MISTFLHAVEFQKEADGLFYMRIDRDFGADHAQTECGKYGFRLAQPKTSESMEIARKYSQGMWKTSIYFGT